MRLLRCKDRVNPARPLRYPEVAPKISKPDKTSLVIDRKKVAAAKKILGTDTIADTVDAALSEVLATEARRRLIHRIRTSKTGGIGPTPEELRRLREP